MANTEKTFVYEDDDAAYRDSIATVDASGKRIWVYPKKPSGRFYNARIWLSGALLALLFGMPFIKIGGEPLLLFNILERKFILFGLRFMPQDFHLFVLAMITMVVFIALFTVVFGRIFCGWVCPQTIFMEMVFRRIEYWIEGDANAQRRLNAAPWDTDKVLRKAAKLSIFFAIAVLVSNTFLAYIIGVDQVYDIITEPISMHLGGFVAMLLFSGAFFFVFAYLREQVCVTICPYGRLQGVLLDQDSIVIAYDFVRGEPRGRIQKSKPKPQTSPLETMQASLAASVAEVEAPALGDCIDCKLCVKVCPTGIDIRNGTQLECVNCTACIDACDEVMDKVERPRGLIRYDSYNGIAAQRRKIFTPRVIAYSVVLAVLLGVNAFLLSSRSALDALVLRTPGMLFQTVDENTISNLFDYQLVNKTGDDMAVEFKLLSEGGQIRLIGNPPVVAAGEVLKGKFFIDMPKEELSGRKTKLRVEVYSEGKLIKTASTNFLGPQ